MASNKINTVTATAELTEARKSIKEKLKAARKGIKPEAPKEARRTVANRPWEVIINEDNKPQTIKLMPGEYVIKGKVKLELSKKGKFMFLDQSHGFRHAEVNYTYTTKKESLEKDIEINFMLGFKV